jgi:excisionase family DNA binding protein
VVTTDRPTIKEAEERLGVTQTRVQQLILAGRLPAQKIGRDSFINEEDLKFVEAPNTGKPPKPKAQRTSRKRAISRWEGEGGAVLPKTSRTSGKVKSSKKARNEHREIKDEHAHDFPGNGHNMRRKTISLIAALVLIMAAFSTAQPTVQETYRNVARDAGMNIEYVSRELNGREIVRVICKGVTMRIASA